MRSIKKLAISSILLFFVAFSVWANETENKDTTAKHSDETPMIAPIGNTHEDNMGVPSGHNIQLSSDESRFNPGEFMLDHITDAHSWHIITLGHNHISVPLPIIVYSQTTGFHCFFSHKLNHGHEYEGLKIGIEGKNKGKIIETINGVETLPWDFSLTKVAFSLILSTFLCLLIFLSVAKKYKQNPGKGPSGLQGALEPIIIFIRDDIAKASIGPKYERYLPFLLTLFFFIWITNTLGLIPVFPGGANVTGNIAVTMVMALFTFAITVASSNRYYWEEIINTPGVPTWLKLPIPLMPVIELLSFFLKPLILMIRLFANITAGHLIALGFVSLIFIFGAINPFLGYGVSLFSAVFSIFMGMLELLVAFIQAFVFTLLSAIYFGQAVHNPHGHH